MIRSSCTKQLHEACADITVTLVSANASIQKYHKCKVITITVAADATRVQALTRGNKRYGESFITHSPPKSNSKTRVISHNF